MNLLSRGVLAFRSTLHFKKHSLVEGRFQENTLYFVGIQVGVSSTFNCNQSALIQVQTIRASIVKL